MYSSPIPVAPDGFRSGFVAIIGRPNVGKSTLMNALVGQKVAITSPVAQTTRNRLRGILTTDAAQFIFVDTPGIHKPHHELGKVLVSNARGAVQSVDVVLLVVDGSVPLGRGDQFIADFVADLLRSPQKDQTPRSVILGLNKLDQQPSDPQEQGAIAASYQALAQEQGWGLVSFSALTGAGTEELLTQLTQRLETGPYYYPPDLVTDQPERFIMGELIREQILLLTRQEVPHSVAVVMDRVEESPQRTYVLATVYVERDSQKGIVIGKRGQMLKQIGSAARLQMQKLIDGKVHLELFVKVQPKWRQSRHSLEDLGYRLEK
ncbi:GTPase Era [Prochlorothrix hollandica]|uniref:GTPase Era n=1 Tax=Prochlorothrix hollandica PCC 9006 = CALU 1027 TaxID=317619 RepID=A0A0M2PU66_PROHO|nr:GTPase Era [Prochlorothrix hollandica PCC 9006 = CALU 1027]